MKDKKIAFFFGAGAEGKMGLPSGADFIFL